MFDLKRPCKSCPFRRDQGKLFLLGRKRIKEIIEAISFQCHKTVIYDNDDEGEEIHFTGDRPQQCAGLMSLLHRERRANTIMQVAQRLGHLDPTQLDPDDVAYHSITECLKDHGG